MDPGRFTIWIGVANHLDLAALTSHVAGLAWTNPNAVQLLVKDESDPWFRLYMITDGRIVQHARTPDPDDTELPW